MLVSTITLSGDPTQQGAGAGLTKGYIYSCISMGTNPGFTCAYTIGTAAEMAANKKTGTVLTTTLLKASDFNAVVAGTTSP